MLPFTASKTSPPTSTPSADSSYDSLHVLESTDCAPKTKTSTRILILVLLCSITMGGLLCAAIRDLACEHCSHESPFTSRQNSQLKSDPTIYNIIPSRLSHWAQQEDYRPSNTSASTLLPRAPPYQDTCAYNDDCDWGYKCIDNTCYPGCDADRDCLEPQYCGVWYWPSKYGADFCLINSLRICKAHLDFCRANEDCCSGNCQRRGIFWKMCQPSSGRSRGIEDEKKSQQGGSVK